MEATNRKIRMRPVMLCLITAFMIMLTVQVTAANVSTWDGLKSAMASSGTDIIVLTDSISELDSTEELVVNGTKTLDINGKNLTVTTSEEINCIFLNTGAKLTIKDSKYTSSSQNKLYVENASEGSDVEDSKAGINTTYGKLVIDSGNIEVYGGKYGAGIGGGDYNDEGAGEIEINGGRVISYGGFDGAGIGGGYEGDGGKITITGGEITAIGGEYAAGIGGGYYGYGGIITITGGVVTAIGGEEAAGIGGGEDGDGGIITIIGGTVTATSGEEGEYYGDGDGFEDFDGYYPAAGIGCGAYYSYEDEEYPENHDPDEPSFNLTTIGGGTVIARGGIAFREAPEVTADTYKYKTNEISKDAPIGDYILSSTAPYKYNTNQKYVEIICGATQNISKDWFSYIRFILANQEYIIRVYIEGKGGEVSLEGLKEIPEDGRTVHKPHSNATFTITPDEGYKISQILIDGEEAVLKGRHVKMNEDGSIEYTFKDILKSYKLKVSFEKLPEETT